MAFSRFLYPVLPHISRNVYPTHFPPKMLESSWNFYCLFIIVSAIAKYVSVDSVVYDRDQMMDFALYHPGIRCL